MLRVVIDTNTLVSGFGWGGLPGAVIDAVLVGHAIVLLSAPLREELACVRHYPKLAQVFPGAHRIVAAREPPLSSRPARATRHGDD
jgi:putative PIN family toxin of toxin-antitoxin system